MRHILGIMNDQTLDISPKICYNITISNPPPEETLCQPNASLLCCLPHCLLLPSFALVDINDLREAEFAFGILPYPMFDESQEEYNNLISTVLVTTASVPYNCKDIDMTGAVLEAMAYYSVDTLTPAYYDNALKGRYVRDEESGDMLDIIFATRVYDLGFIFDWGGAGSLVTKLYQNKSDEFASSVEGIKTKAETAIIEALENFAKLQ